MNKSLLNDKRNRKIISAVNSISSKCLKFSSSCFPQGNCIYRELRRFSFCYKRFVDVLTMGTYKIYFSQHYDFPYNISKNMANTNSKQHVLLMD